MRLGWLLLLLVAARASATSFASPTRHDVKSQNGAFVLDVDPETSTHVLYATNDRGKPSWSFSRPISYERILVSNDGKVVAVLPWGYIRLETIHEAGIEFWSAGGLLMIQPLARICPDPAIIKGPGPIGATWRTWIAHVDDDGTSFAVTTTCGSIVRLRYVDGALLDSRMTTSRRLAWCLRGTLAGVAAAGFVTWQHRRRRRPPLLSRKGAILFG